jgi:pyruvate formate lyase activating enzyme
MNRRHLVKGCMAAGSMLAAGGVKPAGAGLIERLLGGESGRGKEVHEGGAPARVWKWSTEARHYERTGTAVRCTLCPNGCVLPPGSRSRCRVRVNKGGKLLSLVYGNPASVHVDPVEKKPLYHFHPGTGVLSMGYAGCNLHCLNCQNWQISQRKPEELRTYSLFPDEAVDAALEARSPSVAFTYNEPTVEYEFMVDTARAAHEKGLKNVWVTNGYINERPLRELCPFLDAVNVDLKSFSDTTYRTLNAGTLEPVLRTLRVLKEQGVWIEVTTLIVPTYTDDPSMIRRLCRWLYETLGPDYPLHFSRFHPQYKLDHLPPTPPSVLLRARAIAMEEGLRYVYIGNYRSAEGGTTFCPHCQEAVIERAGYVIRRMDVQDGRCGACGREIAGRWDT